MEIGKRIKEYREKNKITQKDFAQKIGATQSFLSLVENGSVDIETSTMLKKSNRYYWRRKYRKKGR